jgi:tetratricopeptide (TPR) repeat protein
MFKEAQPMFHDSHTLMSICYGKESADAAWVRRDNAALLIDLGRYGEAAKMLVTSIDAAQLVGGSDHPRVAVLLWLLGSAQVHQGEYVGAEKAFKRALVIREQRLGLKHPEVALSCHDLAELYRRIGRYHLAKRNCLRALRIRRAHGEGRHQHTARIWNDLAEIYKSNGQYQRAEVLFNIALQLKNSMFTGGIHPDCAYTLRGRADLRRRSGRLGEAFEDYKKALSIAQQTYGVEAHPEYSECLLGQAVVRRDEDKLDDARRLCEEALEQRKKIFVQGHPEDAIHHNRLGDILVKQARKSKIAADRDQLLSSAEEAYTKAISLLNRHGRERHPEICYALNGLAKISLERSEHKKARDLFERSRKQTIDLFGTQHPSLSYVYRGLARTYGIAEPEQAKQNYSLAKKILAKSYSKSSNRYLEIVSEMERLNEIDAGNSIALFNRSIEPIARFFKGGLKPDG